MDVTYVATPMTVASEMAQAVVMVVKMVLNLMTLVESQVATALRPLSIGGTSLSAVSPDHINRKELALAGA